MPTTMQIALVQQPTTPYAIEENVTQAISAISKAKAKGAKLVLFPQGWFQENKEEASPLFANQMKRIQAIKTLQEVAQYLNIHIVISSLIESHTTHYYETLLINRRGEIQLCKEGEEKTNSFPSTQVASAFCEIDGMKVAILHGQEWKSSGLLKRCVEKELDVLLIPNNAPLHHMQRRVLEGISHRKRIAILMANMPKPAGGTSCAFSPQYDFENEHELPCFSWVANSQEEAVMLVEFDLDAITQHKATTRVFTQFA
ncbi:MAG: carbon-nitrogen hydrolase family protein [Erysipelotrichaceae bacterium]